MDTVFTCPYFLSFFWIWPGCLVLHPFPPSLFYPLIQNWRITLCLANLFLGSFLLCFFTLFVYKGIMCLFFNLPRIPFLATLRLFLLPVFPSNFVSHTSSFILHSFPPSPGASLSFFICRSTTSNVIFVLNKAVWFVCFAGLFLSSLFMYFHTSFSVLIFFIPLLSSVSFSLHLSLHFFCF